jgi:hypothetical protein
MNRPPARVGVAIALWLTFVFVAWNVIYDRYVAISAVEFTRQQILRQQRGEPTTSIHTGFSPSVGDAAWRASLWMTPVLAGGCVCLYFTFRPKR